MSRPPPEADEIVERLSDEFSLANFPDRKACLAAVSARIREIREARRKLDRGGESARLLDYERFELGRIATSLQHDVDPWKNVPLGRDSSAQ